MHGSCFPRRQDDPGYVVAWRYKYEFKAGRYPDEGLTYGQAQARAAQLAAERPDMSFWAEPARPGG